MTIFVRKFTKIFTRRLRAIADAQETWAYDHRIEETERQQRFAVAWSLRCVAQAVEECFE